MKVHARLSSVAVCLVGLMGVLPAPAPAVDTGDWPGAYTSISGPACPGGARWRMVMLEYSVNGSGATLSRDPSVLRGYQTTLQEAADTVAQASACAVTWDVDIVDMGPRVYDSGRGADPPSAPVQAYKARGYDIVMFRYPSNGDAADFVGKTNTTSWIQFPAGGSHTESVFPWTTVVIHEWLHDAVQQLGGRGELGFPPDDVHWDFWKVEPYASIYASQGAYAVAMAYYTDLIAGRVPVDGKLKGFSSNDWIMWGTPSHPLRQPANLWVDGGRAKPKGWAFVRVSSSSAEPVSITIDGPGRRWDTTLSVVPASSNGQAPTATARFRSVRGPWRICAVQPADPSARFVADNECTTLYL